DKGAMDDASAVEPESTQTVVRLQARVIGLLDKIAEYERKERQWNDKPPDSSADVLELRKKNEELSKELEEEKRKNVKWEEKYKRSVRETEAERALVQNLETMLDKKPEVIDNSKKMVELDNKVAALTKQLGESEQKAIDLSNALKEERRKSTIRNTDLVSFLAKYEANTASPGTPKTSIDSPMTLKSRIDDLPKKRKNGQDEMNGDEKEGLVGEIKKPKTVVDDKANIPVFSSTSSHHENAVSIHPACNEAAVPRDHSPNEDDAPPLLFPYTQLPVVTPPAADGAGRRESASVPSVPDETLSMITLSEDEAEADQMDVGVKLDGVSSSAVSAPPDVALLAAQQVLQQHQSSTMQQGGKGCDSAANTPSTLLFGGSEAENGQVFEEWRERLQREEVITTVMRVCEGEQTMESAMHFILPAMDATLGVEGVTMCACEALKRLPQANTWEVVRAQMSKGYKTIDLSEIVPKAEKNLIAFLIDLRGKQHPVFDDPLNVFHKNLLSSMGRRGSTAYVTRIVRCLYVSLALTTKKWPIEKVQIARRNFLQILKEESSQAVCQSLVYLLCNTQTASFASEILKTDLDVDEYGGRLISMHMNVEEAEVLRWAVNIFADASCKNLSTAAFRTPATHEMTQKWWDSGMEELEKVKRRAFPNSWSCSKVDSVYESIVMNMSAVISPQFKIKGLDRVNALNVLITTAITMMDQVTPSMPYRKALDSNQILPFETREDRVLYRLIIRIAIATLRAFDRNRMYDVDQKEALQVHLATSIDKVTSILDRPVCNGRHTQRYRNFFACVSVLKEWREAARCVMQNYLTPAPPASGSAQVYSTPPNQGGNEKREMPQRSF
ncbi:hypothetical protein PMAYCL1PPCAC_20739, partial [Pristionchus mayeri]